jgi:acetylornithine/succinyldiaminopimelate/putrescine aminotransferase
VGAFQKGLLILECGRSSVRMAPPLTVSETRWRPPCGCSARPVAAVAELDVVIEAEALEAGALHEVEAAG